MESNGQASSEVMVSSGSPVLVDALTVVLEPFVVWVAMGVRRTISDPHSCQLSHPFWITSLVFG